MTGASNVELLPLPRWMETYLIPGDDFHTGPDQHLSDRMQAYARANMEPLRAEVERLMGCLATANANHEQFERQWYLERDRAERLAEALRGMLDVAAESFANRTYVPINYPQAANAYAALAQEDRNG